MEVSGVLVSRVYLSSYCTPYRRGTVLRLRWFLRTKIANSQGTARQHVAAQFVTQYHLPQSRSTSGLQSWWRVGEGYGQGLHRVGGFVSGLKLSFRVELGSGSGLGQPAPPTAACTHVDEGVTGSSCSTSSENGYRGTPWKTRRD